MKHTIDTIIENDALSAMCDATEILDDLTFTPQVGPIGKQILMSAKQHLQESLRDYLTKGKGQLWY